MNKQLYTILFAIGGCFAAVPDTNAQCTCANGATPDSVVYTFTLAPTSDFSTPITFPQFNPTLGTLNCLRLTSTMTAVAELAIRNRDSLPRDYEFLYTQAIGFSGPGGLSNNATTTRTYGPTSLSEYGLPGDSVHYGPDTLFKDKILTRTITNVAPYLGTGNVTVNFTNTGSTLLLQGSNNYQATVSTFASGDFRLNYYYCAAATLANGLKNFNATRKDSKVLLQWMAENEVADARYEMQVSVDGKNFNKIEASAIRVSKSNNSSAYEYYYKAKDGFEGRIYFRIKQLNPGGGISLSSIRFVEYGNGKENTISIYPNPIIRKMVITFPRMQTGDLRVEIVNNLGQAIYSKTHSLTAQSQMELRLEQNTSPGSYYLRIKNLKTNENMVQKIFLQ